MSASITAALTVTDLNRLVRETLETRLPLLWISGEISNLTRASSGHLYFTLKDEQAQVRCTVWRNRAQLLPFRPENGQRIKALAIVTLYEARGDYQLNIETLRPDGIGSLFEAFTRLKDKLTAEGLFNPALCRPIPLYPRAIGIITSPAAAALQDVRATLLRRAPHLPLILYPAPVQGADAPGRLISALEEAIRHYQTHHVDLLLLVRGGGSLEDLWAFNDESLARTLKISPIPVITGIGHETDFTIADFAADQRAPTPTGAAELASAGYHAAQARLSTLSARLNQAIHRRIQGFSQRLDQTGTRLIHPRERLQRNQTQLQQLRQRLNTALSREIAHLRYRQQQIEVRLHSHRPEILSARLRCQQIARRLQHSTQRFLRQQHNALDALHAHLQHLNPRAVLIRGYSITRDSSGRILRSTSDIAAGARLLIQLADGQIKATADSMLADAEGAPCSTARPPDN